MFTRRGRAPSLLQEPTPSIRTIMKLQQAITTSLQQKMNSYRLITKIITLAKKTTSMIIEMKS